MSYSSTSSPARKTASAHWPVLWGGSPRRGTSLYHHCKPPRAPHAQHTVLSDTLPEAHPHSPVQSPLSLHRGGGTVQGREGSPTHTKREKKVGHDSARPAPCTCAMHCSLCRCPGTAVASLCWAFWATGSSWGTGCIRERRHTHNYFTKDWAEQGMLTRCTHVPLTTRAPPPLAFCPARGSPTPPPYINHHHSSLLSATDAVPGSQSPSSSHTIKTWFPPGNLSQTKRKKIQPKRNPTKKKSKQKIHKRKSQRK